MSEMTNNTSRKYVAEIVWLPAYAVIVIFTLSAIESSWLATAVMITALILGRMLFELLSRIFLGDGRLYFRSGIIIFVVQVVIIGALFAWMQ